MFVSNRNLPERRSFFDDRNGVPVLQSTFAATISVTTETILHSDLQWHSTQCTALWAVWINPSPHPALRTQPLQPPVASTGLQEHVGPDAWLRQWAIRWPVSLPIVLTHGRTSTVHSAQTVVQCGLIMVADSSYPRTSFNLWHFTVIKSAHFRFGWLRCTALVYRLTNDI